MNVVTHYVCMSTDQIRTHARRWINRGGKKSQKNQMMVKVILDSISKNVRHKITNKKTVISVGNSLVRSGNIILKIIMSKTIIDTRATSAAFIYDLGNLDFFMSSCNSNIETFNAYVNHAVRSLQARGDRVNDLLTNLFKRYKIATDVKFVASIDLWESNWM